MTMHTATVNSDHSDSTTQATAAYEDGGWRTLVYPSSVLAIFVVGIGLRAWRLGTVPGPLADEVLAAASLRSLFDSRSGGVLSIVTPILDGRLIVKTFLGTRLVDLRVIPVAFGLGTIAVTIDLVKRLFGRAASLLAGCAVAIMPWAIYYSRIFFPASEYIFLSLLMIYAGVALAHQRSRWWLPVCCASAAVTIYIYPASIVTTPLFLLAITASYRKAASRLPASTWLWGSLLLPVLLVPYAWAHLVNVASGTATSNGVIGSRELFRSGLPFATELVHFFQSYLSYFTPSYLLFHGDPNPAQSVQVIGEVGPIITALGFVGILISLRKIRYPQYLLMVLLLLVFPVGDALTLQNSIGNSDVAALGVIPWGVLAGIGAAGIARWIGELGGRLTTLERRVPAAASPVSAAAARPPAVRVMAPYVVALLFVSQVSLFAPRYFGRYNNTYPSYFESGFTPVASILARKRTIGLPVTIDAGYDRSVMFSYFLDYQLNITSVYQSCQLLPLRTVLYSVAQQVIVIREGRDYGAMPGCVNQLTLIPRQIQAFARAGGKTHVEVLGIFYNDPNQLAGPRYETAVLLLQHGPARSATYGRWPTAASVSGRGAPEPVTNRKVAGERHLPAPPKASNEAFSG